MDPATISALAGAAQGIVGGIGGVITYGSRKRELERQQSRAQEIQREQEEAAKKARGAIQDYQVGRGARQAFMMSQQDRAGDIAQREIQRQSGAGLGALQAGGARALIGGAGAMASGAARAAEQAAASSDARRKQAQTDLQLKSKLNWIRLEACEINLPSKTWRSRKLEGLRLSEMHSL
jgi:hypothetical protein